MNWCIVAPHSILMHTGKFIVMDGKIGDLLPTAGPHGCLWLILAIIGFVMALAAVLYIAGRLSAVAQPITMSAAIAEVVRQNDLSGRETEIVSRGYRRVANINGATSLSAYEARRRRLQRIASSNANRAETYLRQAAEITADVHIVFARAFMDLIRARSTQAIRGGCARAAYAAFTIGVDLFALGTNYEKSERDRQIAIVKRCGEARKAAALAAKLPPVCLDVLPGEPDWTTSGAEGGRAGARSNWQPYPWLLYGDSVMRSAERVAGRRPPSRAGQRAPGRRAAATGQPSSRSGRGTARRTRAGTPMTT